MRRDLSATAAGNSTARAAQAGRVGLSPATDTAFRAHIADSVFSTNASAEKILAFDELSQVMHTRGLHIHQAGGDVRAGLAAYRKGQGQWFRRHSAFEAL